MLVARLQEVTQAISELRSLEQQATDAEALSTRARQLEDPSMQLHILAQITQAFQQRGIWPAFNRRQLAAVAKEVEAAAVAYHDAPQRIADANEQRYTLWEPLKTLPGQVKDTLLQAWQDYIATALPEQNPELLQTLGQLPGFKEPVEQIRRLQREVEDMRRRLPQSPDEMDRVTVSAAELRAAWQQLPTGGIPADVHDFLTAAVMGNARLSQLTNSVLEWLRTNNLINDVRISLKA